MPEIHKVFSDASFVLLKDGIKFPPLEKGWQKPENAHTFEEAIKHHGNVGILAGNGYIGLDQDHPEAFHGLDIPATTTWETRPDRLGMRFKCSDSEHIPEILDKYGKKADIAQIILSKDGKHVGEIKLQRSYQTIPPSWKRLDDGQRVDYRFLTEPLEPAKISLERLLSNLQNIGITFSSKEGAKAHLEANAARLEDIAKEIHLKKSKSDESRDKRYAQAALESEITILASTTEGDRNNQLYLSSINLAQFVGAGLLDETEIVERLSKAGTYTGLDAIEVERTIRSGVETGIKEPRKIPTIWDKIESDPRIIKEPWALKALSFIRNKDPIDFDLHSKLFKKIGIKIDTINLVIDQYVEQNNDQFDEKIVQEEAPEDVKANARYILEHGSLVNEQVKYAQKHIKSDGTVERVASYVGNSSFMNNTEDLLHQDAVGSSQIGKSTRIAAVLSTFPEDSVIILTELSPKGLYYLTQDTDLHKKIIYVDDARYDHIPTLKTFRNDSPVPPRNMTVVDGKSVDIVLEGRPAVIASSVMPLMDHEGQAITRAILTPVTEPNEKEKSQIKSKIRHKLEYGKLIKPFDNSQRDVLREAERTLRDEGITSVVIPFDAKEPDSADNRGTGQFVRLIKVSAFIHQFRRPILEMVDGSKHILATFEDLENAVEIWFSFDLAQEFKITEKDEIILKALPTEEPREDSDIDFAPTISGIARDVNVKKGVGSQKTVERYLNGLYDKGVVSRKQINATGCPFAYWTDKSLRQKLLSKRSEAGDIEDSLRHLQDKKRCLKELAKNSPVYLVDSIYSFFTLQDIINRNNVKGMRYTVNGRDLSVGAESILHSYLLLFPLNLCLKEQNASNDAESLRHGKCLKDCPMSIDADLQDISNLSKDCLECLKENTNMKSLNLFRDDRHRSAKVMIPPVEGEVGAMQNNVLHAPTSTEDEEVLRKVFAIKGKTISYNEIAMYLVRNHQWAPHKTCRIIREAEHQGWLQTQGEDSKRVVELLGVGGVTNVHNS